MAFRREKKRPSGLFVDMTPMVDIMMLLVIFFMMSTAFVSVYPGFTVNLPKVSANQQPDVPIAVFINSEGRIAVDGQEVTLANLTAALKNSNTSQPAVSIRADKAVSHGRVMEVMSAIRQAGITKMAIATEPVEP